MYKLFLFKFLPLVLALGLGVAPMFAQNQTTERAKNRAKYRTNQRVDQKIDQGVDRALDKVEGLFRRKNRSSAESPTAEPSTSESQQGDNTDEESMQELPVGGIFGGLRSKDFEPFENPVAMSFVMDVSVTNKRGKTDEMQINCTFDTWQTGMQTSTDDGEMRLILDNKEGYLTVITKDQDGELTAMRMQQRAYDLSDVEPDPDNYTVRATGNTRKIDGYQCSEYIIEHEDGTTTSWVTKDLDIDYADFVRAMASQASASRQKILSGQPNYGYEGFPILSTTVSKDGKETTIMHIKDILIGDQIDRSIFDIEGVKVTNLGF